MMQPYCGLLLNGHKTLETRHTPFLRILRGRLLAIHCGQKDWPAGKGGLDGWRVAAVSDPSLASSPADAAFSPPAGRGLERGTVCGVVQVGETRACSDWAATEGWDSVERRALVPRASLAAFATEILGTRWLPSGVAVRGLPGVFRVDNLHAACHIRRLIEGAVS